MAALRLAMPHSAPRRSELRMSNDLSGNGTSMPPGRCLYAPVRLETVQPWHPRSGRIRASRISRRFLRPEPRAANKLALPGPRDTTDWVRRSLYVRTIAQAEACACGEWERSGRLRHAAQGTGADRASGGPQFSCSSNYRTSLTRREPARHHLTRRDADRSIRRATRGECPPE